MTEPLVEPHKQGVIPRRTRGLDLLHQRRIPTLKRNTKGNICKRIGCLTADGIRRAGKLSLIDGPFLDQMEPASSGVSSFQNESSGQLRLKAQTVLLRH